MKAGYWVTTKHDGRVVREQAIEDPFHTTTVIIHVSGWEWFKTMFRRRYDTSVQVSLNASPPVVKAVMNLDVPHPGPGKESVDHASRETQDT